MMGTENEGIFTINKTIVYGLLAFLLNVVYVGMPLWLHNDVIAQVKKKVDREVLEVRLKNLEEKARKAEARDIKQEERMDKVEKVTDKLDWWLNQQQEVRRHYDTTRTENQ